MSDSTDMISGPVKSSTDTISGPITGVSAYIREEKWEYGDHRDKAEPNTAMCFLHITASIDGDAEDVVLIDQLLGIYSGDDRPTIAHFVSIPSGIATGYPSNYP